MELLIPKIKPIRLEHESFADTFGMLASDSDEVWITTGYISISSILFLKENIESDNLPPISLTVGMHAFDHFTQAQYDAVYSLADYVKATSLGQVQICTAFPFHGKIYSFRKNSKPFSAIMGSSNLTALEESRLRIFEADIKLTEEPILRDISSLQSEIESKSTTPFLDWTPKKIKKTVAPISGLPDVQKVSKSTVLQTKNDSKAVFKLRLKPEARSNLNVYFGKGRLNTRTGLIRPRPWYEIEVIVSSDITSNTGFPFKREFEVITDDGWRFMCKTSGDYSKNFRSEGGLIILGSWIKGRMEAAGALKVGELITKEHLKKYGTEHLILKSTSDLNLFYLSFDTGES